MATVFWLVQAMIALTLELAMIRLLQALAMIRLKVELETMYWKAGQVTTV